MELDYRWNWELAPPRLSPIPVTKKSNLVYDELSPASTDNPAQRKRDRDNHQNLAARIAGTYLLVGILWIVLSDLILTVFGGFTASGLFVSVGKGFGFVVLSAGLVFGLCRREYRKSAHDMGLLRAVVEGTTDAVFVKDRDGRYLLVNDAGSKFIGRPASEIIGRNDLELFEGKEAEQVMANDREIMVSGKVISRDETLTSSGVSRTYHATKAPYFDANGNLAGLIGIGRDITDRRLVESALRETESRLREAQRIARLGSWSWYPQTNKVWWSDAEFELFGLAPGSIEASFDAFLAFLHPDDRQVAIARVESLFAGDTEIANDFRVILEDGTRMWIHSQARATRDDTGRLVLVEGTDQDITTQHLAREAAYESERRADAANRAKSEFLANMSHEIRTPLTAILGFAEVLREDNSFAAPQQWIHDLNTIASAGKHLLSIINDILDLSKIEADKTSLEFIETPLIEVLSEVEHLLRTTASGKGVLLSAKLTTPVPDRILSDPTRLLRF